MSKNVARLRRERLVQHLHDLGPPALGHFLAELGEEAGCQTAIERRLEEYATIDPRIVRAFRGHRYPPMLHVVNAT